MMAISIPGAFDLADFRLIQPGEPIGIGPTSAYPLRAHARMLHKLWARGAGDGAIHCHYEEPLDPGSAYSSLGVVSVPAWSIASPRWVLVARLKNCSVRVRIGATTLATVTAGGTLSYQTSSAFVFSAGSLTDDRVAVTLEGKVDEDPGEIKYIALCEEEHLAANLPDGTLTNTRFRALDDDRFLPDRPYSTSIAQTLHNAPAQIARWRMSHAGHAYPSQRPFYCGSVEPMAFGPWLKYAPAGAAEMSVAFNVSEVSGLAGCTAILVNSSVMTNGRAYSGDDIDIAASAAARMQWDGVPCRPDAVNVIWLVVRSGIDSKKSVAPSSHVNAFFPPGRFIHESTSKAINTNCSMSGFDANRWVIVKPHARIPATTDEVDLDGDIPPANDRFDLASVLGTDVVGAQTRSQFEIWPPNILDGDFSLRQIGVIRIDGVSIWARGPGPRFVQAQRANQLPAASVVDAGSVEGRVLGALSTPDIAISHGGYDRQDPFDQTLGGVDFYNVGPWFMLDADTGTDTLSIMFPLPISPSRGESGEAPGRIHAQLLLAAVQGNNQGTAAEVCPYALEFPNLAGGDSVEDYLPVYRGIDVYNAWREDATAAALMGAAYARQVVAVDDRTDQHAWYRQGVHARELTQGRTGGILLSPVVSGDVPDSAAYPLDLELEVTNKGPALEQNDQPLQGSVTLIILGAAVWYGPRT